MTGNQTENTPSVSAGEKEIGHLKQQVLEKEQARKEENAAQYPDRGRIIEETISEYALSPRDAFKDDVEASPKKQERIRMHISKEQHDAAMEELIDIAMADGIKAALDTVEQMRDPHITDDFHRFLTAYVKHHTEGRELFRDTKELAIFDMTLYEVSLSGDGGGKAWQEVSKEMKRFLAVLLSLTGDTDEGERISLEIAVSPNYPNVLTYIAVPSRIQEEFQKALTESLPDARVFIAQDDYNVFNDDGVSLGARGKAALHPALSLAGTESFSQDPLTPLFEAFKSLENKGEGASLQIVFRNPQRAYMKQYGIILDQLKQGKDLKAATAEHSLLEEFGRVAKDMLGSSKHQEKEGELNMDVISSVNRKLRSTITECNIRMVVSADTNSRAEEMQERIEGVLRQFDTDASGGIVLENLGGRRGLELFKQYSYRTFDPETFVPLNLDELSSLFRPAPTPARKSPKK